MSTSLTISGKVADQNSAALSGVVVSVEGEGVETPYTAVTGEEGHFELRDLPPPGQYLVSASIIGFMDWKKPVVVQPGQTFVVNITMYEE